MKLRFTPAFDDLKADAAELVRETGIELYRCAAGFTPVRSGRARANWFCGVNAENNSSDESIEYDDSRAGEAFSAAVPGDVLTVSNNLPYILKLEQGSSGQAPFGISVNALRSVQEFLEGRQA